MGSTTAKAEKAESIEDEGEGILEPVMACSAGVLHRNSRKRDATGRIKEREAAEAAELEAGDFLARFMAFRQHVEMLLQFIATKTARTKPWKLTLHRASLCNNVIRHFSCDFSKTKLFQRTEVAFIDAYGIIEDGIDQ